MDSSEFEHLHERPDDEADFQLTQVFPRTNSWSMTKAEVENIFRAASVHRHIGPAFRNKVERGITRGLNAPVILVPVRVPDVQKNMGPLWDPQSPSIRGFDPGIGCRPAWKKIERRGQAKSFVQDVAKVLRVVKVFGRIIQDVFYLVEDFFLSREVSGKVRDRPACVRSGRFESTARNTLILLRKAASGASDLNCFQRPFSSFRAASTRSVNSSKPA